MSYEWRRLRLETDARLDTAETKRLRSPRGDSVRPWILLLGSDPVGLERAARHAMVRLGSEIPCITLPSEPALPILLHRLPAPRLQGERALYVPHLERAFFDTLAKSSFSAASPQYLLAKLSALAGEGEPLHVVATAMATPLETGGGDVLAQRGLASRFEIRQADGATDARAPLDIGVSSVEPTPVDALLSEGLRTGDAQLRESRYQQAVTMAPTDALPHLFLASALSEQEEISRAVKSLRRAIECDPNLAAAHYELGKAHIRSGDASSVPDAIASFERTTELLPEFASAFANLGAARGETGDTAGAVPAFERAIELDPLSHALRSNLGVAYRDQGRLAEAETELLRVVDMAPDFVFGHYNLANVHYLQGRYRDAIAEYEKARTMDRSASARQALLLAVTRLAAGDREEALADYRAIFERLDARSRGDLRAVAEWDLTQLAERAGVTPDLKEAARLVRSYS